MVPNCRPGSSTRHGSWDVEDRRRLRAPSKKLRGTHGPDRVAPNEIQATGTPTPPPWLDKAALEEWDRVTPLLAAANVVAEIDQATLAACCSNFAIPVAFQRKASRARRW